MFLAFPHFPRLELYHHHAVRSTASCKGEACHLVECADFRNVFNAFLHFCKYLVGLVQCASGRGINAYEEGAGVLVRHEARLRCAHEVHQGGNCTEEAESRHPFVSDEECHSELVFLHELPECGFERHAESCGELLRLFPRSHYLVGLEKQGAQCRGQCQGVDCRQAHGHGHGKAELLVEHT